MVQSSYILIQETTQSLFIGNSEKWTAEKFMYFRKVFTTWKLAGASSFRLF